MAPLGSRPEISWGECCRDMAGRAIDDWHRSKDTFSLGDYRAT